MWAVLRIVGSTTVLVAIYYLLPSRRTQAATVAYRLLNYFQQSRSESVTQAQTTLNCKALRRTSGQHGSY